MGKSAQTRQEFHKELHRERRQAATSLLVVFSCVIIGVLLFLHFYNAYIDQTLYAERLSQMREVTTQLFSGLEDVVNNEWRTVNGQCNTLESARPQSAEALHDFMQQQAKNDDLEEIQCEILAVDENGRYYTQMGQQGLLEEREYLISEPERISYVSNSLISDETRMVFLKRLDSPVMLRSGDKKITLKYYGISQNMEQLNPYFECAAYSGNSSVYVTDEQGLKLFSSRSDSKNELLKGFNCFTTLRQMNYLHGTSFDDASKELDEHGLAYSNAILDGTEMYYAVYRMENAAWTLIFLVPSDYVATNTVDLVNMTIRLVMIFSVILITVSMVTVVWLTRKQQKAALEAEHRNNENLTRINAELSLAVRTAENATKEAEKANKAKSEFLTNMSHDIRTPMNAIVGITNLMEHEEGGSDKLHTYIEKVQLSSQHLLSLINDVLDMSKIESEEVSLNEEPVSLSDQLQQVDNIIRPQAQERGQEFRIRVRRIAYENVITDGVRLRQVLLNLLSNAVKYTPNGGKVRLELEGIPCDRKDCASFRLLVQDNGYGMTQEFLEHIFEPFTRAESSVTNKVQGTGLGMAITKNIVDMMGGTIVVQSTPGQGSCFTVTLTFPIDHSVEWKTQIRELLLLSQDEELIRNIRTNLETVPIRIFSAGTQEEAEAVLRERSVDAVLMNGYLGESKLPGVIQALRSSVQSGSTQQGVAPQGNVPHSGVKKELLIFGCEETESDEAQGIIKACGADGLIVRPFFLSKLVQAEERARGIVKADADAGHGLKGVRFLCAEDNDLNAEILEALLEMNGASCVIYPNGKALVEAFAEVQPEEFDAILMDVQMPVMNGLEATRAIRSGENPLGRTIPVIAMTANAFAEDVQHCLEAGMNAHVAKPVDIATLERTYRMVTGGGQKLRNKR